MEKDNKVKNENSSIKFDEMEREMCSFNMYCPKL